MYLIFRKPNLVTNGFFNICRGKRRGKDLKSDKKLCKREGYIERECFKNIKLYNNKSSIKFCFNYVFI